MLRAIATETGEDKQTHSTERTAQNAQHRRKSALMPKSHMQFRTIAARATGSRAGTLARIGLACLMALVFAPRPASAAFFQYSTNNMDITPIGSLVPTSPANATVSGSGTANLLI